MNQYHVNTSMGRKTRLQTSAKQSIPFKEGFLTLVVLILVVGSLILAVMDENFRPAFADLAKVGVGGYIGWMIPRQ